MALERLARASLSHAEPDARYAHHVVLSAMNRLRSHAVAQAAGLKFRPLSQLLDLAKPIYLQIEAASPSVGNDGRALTREGAETDYQRRISLADQRKRSSVLGRARLVHIP